MSLSYTENHLNLFIKDLTPPWSFARFRTSITAQKIVDERHGPHHTDLWWQSDRRARPFNHFYSAGSAFKGKEEGCVSSFKAARYYTEEAAKRRDQLISEVSADN